MKAVAWTDGAALPHTSRLAGWGFILRVAGGPTVKEHGHIGIGTNNIAEWTAVLKAVQAAKKNGVRELLICSDSQLVVKQLIGEYRVKDHELWNLRVSVLNAAKGLHLTAKWIPREQNGEADALSKLGLIPPGETGEAIGGLA